MRQFVRSGLIASIVGLARGGRRRPGARRPSAAQGHGPRRPRAPARPRPRTAPARPAILDQVLATVNGEPITRGDSINTFNTMPGESRRAPVNDADLYRVGIEGLVQQQAGQAVPRQAEGPGHREGGRRGVRPDREEAQEGRPGHRVAARQRTG